MTVIIGAVVSILIAMWAYGQIAGGSQPSEVEHRAEVETRTAHDILQENNKKSEQEVQRIKNSIGKGDTLEDDGRGHYKVQRADGSEEHYETVSGFAGFATVRTK